MDISTVYLQPEFQNEKLETFRSTTVNCKLNFEIQNCFKEIWEWTSQQLTCNLNFENAYLDGTIFCSDSWKAYNKLAEHLDLDNTIYFPVNHSKNFVI